MLRTHFMTDDDYEEDTMKNKKFIAFLAMTVALSGVMTACGFGGDNKDSVVVESTPTPTPAKKAKVTPTVAADAQNTTYTSKDKSVAIKLPDATWANKSDETDMLSFESPDQGKILILHGSGADLESAVIPNSQDMAVSMTQAENMVNGTDFEIQDYKADQKDGGINIYSYTVKYKDTTKSDGYVYAINKYFVNDSEYYSIVASVKTEDALKKVQESVDSFAILGDSTLKSAATGSAAKTAGKSDSASKDSTASGDSSAAGTASDGTSAGGSTSSDGTTSDGSAASDGSTSSDGTASDGTSTDGSTSSDGSSSGAIVNGGFTDEQLSNTDETRTIYRNSDGKPRVIVPDGNGKWMDNEGNRFTFSTEHDCDVYEEDGTSFYWHGEGADVYYMPVQ